MKKSIISLLIIASLHSTSLFAEEATTIIKEDQNIEKTNNTIFDIRSLDNKESRIEYVKQFVLKNGDILVPVSINEEIVNVPILSYLLLNNYEEEAVEILNSGNLKPFVKFKYKDGEQSDIVIAMENKLMYYFEAAVNKINDVNEQYKYNNEEGFYLLLHSAAINDELTYDRTLILLKNGANEHLQTKNNLTAEDLAEFENNRAFLEALHSFRSNLQNSDKFLEKNTPLSKKEKLEEKDFINVLITEKLDKLKAHPENMYKVWTQFIIMGYNEAADILLDELSKNEDFDINKANNRGLSPLMAAAMSETPGGNVEYAKKLIKLGAIASKSYDGVEAAQIAVARDNYKVLSVLLLNGANPTSKNKSGHNLFEQALMQKPAAIRSAYLIKEFLKKPQS